MLSTHMCADRSNLSLNGAQPIFDLAMCRLWQTLRVKQALSFEQLLIIAKKNFAHAARPWTPCLQRQVSIAINIEGIIAL